MGTWAKAQGGQGGAGPVGARSEPAAPPLGTVVAQSQAEPTDPGGAALLQQRTKMSF